MLFVSTAVGFLTAPLWGLHANVFPESFKD